MILHFLTNLFSSYRCLLLDADHAVPLEPSEAPPQQGLQVLVREVEQHPLQPDHVIASLQGPRIGFIQARRGAKKPKIACSYGRSRP